MTRSKFILRVLLVCLIVISRDVVFGQEYPNKPIRLVTSAAGGGSDLIARLIAQGISSQLGQSIIVDNRGGVIPGDIVMKSQPDGYTLLVAGGSFWIEQFLHEIPYDPLNDFAPITLAISSPNILVVNPSLPVKSVKDLIALAKAKPGVLNFGTGGPGSNPHLSAELFKAMAGVNIVHVPYQGQGPALTGVIGNEVQLTFSGATSALPLIKAGRVLALAVTTLKPSAVAPGLPTMNEFLPGFEAGLMNGVFASARTPEALVKRLNLEIVRFLQTPATKERILNLGADVVGSSPEGFTAAMRADIAKWGKVIKNAGIRAN